MQYQTVELNKYEEIVGDGVHIPPYRNPLFRRGLMLSLLRDEQWYDNLLPMLIQMPWPFFIRSNESPANLPGFWVDSANKFQSQYEFHKHALEVYQTMGKDKANLSDTPRPDLSILIHRLVRTYILRRTEEKTDLKWEKIKEQKNAEGKIDVPPDWREAREKVASNAFLAARSRRESDFVDFFTSTFCYFKQYLPLDDDFQIVAKALLDEPDKVKTLTLLALSANS